MKVKNYLLGIVVMVISLPLSAQTWLEKGLNGLNYGSTSPTTTGSPNNYGEPLDTAWRLGDVGIGTDTWPLTKLQVHNSDNLSGSLATFLSNIGGYQSREFSGIFTNGGSSSYPNTMGVISLAERYNTSGNTGSSVGLCGVALADHHDEIAGVFSMAYGDNNNLSRGAANHGYGTATTLIGTYSRAWGVSSLSIGVQGVADAFNNSSSINIGVEGLAEDTPTDRNTGVHGRACDATTMNIGVWGESCATNTGTDYAGYFDGDVHIVGTLTGPSDKRLKENVKELGSTLGQFSKIKTYSYTFKPNTGINLPSADLMQYGVIAQELEKVYPELVFEVQLPSKNENGEFESYKTVNYMALIPLLLNSINELNEKVQQLEKERVEGATTGGNSDVSVNALEGKVNGNTKDKDFASMKLMPNPSNDYMDISVNYPQCSNCSLVITDLQGKLLKNIPLNGSTYTVYKNEIGQGVYLCNLVVEGKYVSSERMVFL